MKMFVLISITATFLACAKHEPIVVEPPKPETFQLNYTVANNGLCFAYVLSPTSYGYTVASLTWIPCDVVQAAEKQLEEKKRQQNDAVPPPQPR